MRKERDILKVSQLETNNGQLGWLPKNPRQWTQTDIDRTKASIQEDTDFLEDRPLLVCPGLSGKYVVFGGNLRLTAARSLKLKEVPVVVYCLDEGGPEQDEIRETVKRRAMKDNGAFGAWDYDALANEWDDLPLQDWGVPAWKEDGPAPDEFGEDFKLPDGEKSDFCTMNFQVSTEQRDLIQSALREIKETAEYAVMDTHGNNNTNGNALALIVEMYGKMQRNSD